MSKRIERPFAKCRREAGLTLQSAAIRLRITERHLRALELGRGPLSPVLASRMATTYATTVSQLTRPNAAQP